MRHYLYAGAAIAALVAPVSAHAQETTSSVRGTVTAAGKPVAGATVTITHEPSGTTSNAVTDENGTYGFNGLRAGGPFTVKVKADGYEDGGVTELTLTPGSPTRLPITIEQGSEIIVTASKSKAIDTSNGPITALTRDDIDGVASINRDIRDLARRDPLVSLDLANSRTIEIAGQNGRLNRFSVDGVQFSDDFGLNNGGLPTSRGPVPFDAIEQFSVKTAPFDVSEGDFQGGSINVILKSGGNKFKGTGFFTYTDDSLTGSKTRTTAVNLDFNSKQYGATLSGPIIKDKLFFMVSYERTDETDPFDDGVGPGFANQVPGVTAAQIDQITTTARSVYNIDTLGSVENAVEHDEKIIGKLDWNVTDDQRVSLTYIRNLGTQQFQQNTFTTPPFSFGLSSNSYELAEEVNSGSLQINSTWSDKLSTEFRASYRDYNRDQTPLGGRNNAQFEVCLDPTSINLGTNGITSCGGSRLFFGPDVSRQTNDLNTSNLSLDFTAKLDAGKHSFKMTAGYTRTNTFNLFLQRSLGDLYFDSVADFQNRSASRLRLGNAVPSLNPDDAAASFRTTNFTFGLQDDVQVNDQLVFNFGVRYDLFDNNTAPILNNNFLARTGFPNTSTFKGRGVFQPRFGFNYEASDRLNIRGGVGIFAGGTPDVFLSNSYSNTGQLTNAIDVQRSTAAIGCNVPTATPNAAAICSGALTNVTGTSFNSAVTGFLATNTASLALAPVNAIDPNLKIARQMKAAFSIDHDTDLGPLGDGWLFGGQVLYSKNVFGYTWVDARSVRVGTLPDGRPRYGPVGGFASTNQDLIMTNSTRGYSLAGVVRFEKSWDFGLTIDGSYTRSKTRDENALTSATAGSLYGNNAFLDPNRPAFGRSIYELTNQYKFGIDFKRKFFGDNFTRINFFGELRTGRPYSVTALDNTGGRLAVLGTVGNGGRPLLFVPNVGDARVSFDTVASETAFNSLVSQLGLEKFRGRIVPKNSQNSPSFFKVDMHVEQEIPGFFKGSKFKVFADIENVLNLLNKDWGSLRQVAFPYTSALVRLQCLTVPVATGTAPTTAQISTSAATNCAQFRYSSVLAPTVATVVRPSLYAIRVGAKFSF